MFKDMKIGDRIHTSEKGWGEVIALGNGDHPMLLKFEYLNAVFALESEVCHARFHQTQFGGEAKIKAGQRPSLSFGVDSKVLVWNNEGESKKKRYFKEFDTNGKITCFVNGATSWTATNEVEWEHWELAE